MEPFALMPGGWRPRVQSRRQEFWSCLRTWMSKLLVLVSEVLRTRKQGNVPSVWQIGKKRQVKQSRCREMGLF
jgi:hypothetical protein